MKIYGILILGWDAYKPDLGEEYPTTGYSRLPIDFAKGSLDITYPYSTRDWVRRWNTKTQADD